MSKKRAAIPRPVQRKLMLECGYACSVPRCGATHGLEFHHINADPGDNREENLLVLCANHHSMVGAPNTKLDRKACELLKKTIAELQIPRVTDRSALAALWKRVLESEGGRERYEAFEILVASLLEMVPGFVVVKRRARTPTEEIDVLIRNECPDLFVGRLGNLVIVECKALKSRVGAIEVANLNAKLSRRRRATVGMLFSASGFTTDATRHLMRSDELMILAGPADIERLLEAEDDRVLLEEVKELVTGALLW